MPTFNPKLILAGLGLAIVAAVLFYIGALDRHLSNEQVSHAETKVAVATGQVTAQVEQQARNQQTAGKQETINEDVLASYRQRIAALERDLAAQRLRRQAQGQAAASPAGSADLPSLPAPTDGATEAPSCDADRIQLDELINWVFRQHAVDPNAPLSKEQS